MLIKNKVIGHRGAAAYAPENTLAAFNKALDLGCTAVEFDVMCSADGEPFVIHDETLKRTTNGKGEVGLVDAAYLKTLDAGSWFSKRFKGESLAHFKEVLQWLASVTMEANIEIKPYKNNIEQTVIAVLSCINQYWPREKSLPLISSFEWDALDLCRSIAPEIPLGLLMHQWDESWEQRAKQLGCYSIHINKKIAKEERIKKIKEQGYCLYVYTVNRRRLAKKLHALGVDAVFSDYPDLLT